MVGMNSPVEIKSIDPEMKPGNLLKQTGWFYLRDVFKVLDREDHGHYKLAFKQIERLTEQGRDPFEVMGRSKMGGRVIVLMERFAPWYRKNPIFKTKRLDESVSFNAFLGQRDCFYRLSEVCRVYKDFLPYSYAILRRGADKHEDPLKEVGILKTDTTYLVALPEFEKWLRDELLG